MTEIQRRLFSGVQPTGDLHLGNYLGAIRHFAPMQNDYECIFCVVDMHAITVWQDPARLRQKTREVAAAYIATGVDCKRSIIFNQSQVMQHAELSWIFNCVARIGWMNRMAQFKDKAGSNRENASLGLYAYPCLMAADILLYRATHVPTGEDQKQHLELTRDIARKFNNDYEAGIREAGFSDSQFFPVTEPLISNSAMRIMSLRDGNKKMSKSDPSEMSCIALMDSADDIARKFRKAKTDSEPLPSSIEELAGRPEARNLVEIYSALDNRTPQDVLNEFVGRGFGAFKPALAELAVAHLSPISAEITRLLADPAELDGILRQGAERAAIHAEKTMKHVRRIVGFLN